MTYLLRYGCLLLVVALVVSCGSKTKEGNNRLSTNDVTLAIDESFRPIMEEELSVFNARFPQATLYPHYVTETAALNLLLKDSVRFVLTTRKLSEKEKQSIEARKFKATERQIASDAIALITNTNNPDSLITLDEIRGIMTGKITRWEQLAKSKQKGLIEVVFDNQNSSTVRYIQDSICGEEAFKGNLKAQQTNSEVISYIQKSPQAIGVVGADWIKNPNDTSRISFDPRIQVMLVSRFSGENAAYFRPFQYYIATGEYPLTRSVYMIMTDPFSTSMTRNLFYFLSDTDGQLIITKNSQLLPYAPVQVKQVKVN